MLYTIMAIIVSVILIFLGIAVLVLIHVCIVGRALRRGLGNENMVGRDGAGNTSMSRDDLEKLPCFEYMVVDKGNSSPVDCAVCLENFKTGEKCRLLPTCKHSFHAQCVDEWLLVTPICPICRTSTAESLKGCGGESSHHSDSSLDLRANNPENGQLDNIRNELTETGDRSLEMGNHQTSES